jgi:hypothetical protein
MATPQDYFMHLLQARQTVGANLQRSSVDELIVQFLKDEAAEVDFTPEPVAALIHTPIEEEE